MYYIYEIKNHLTGDTYIGCSKRPFGRFSSHMNLLEKGKHHSTKFQSIYDNIERCGWAFRILEQSDTPDEACKIEERNRMLYGNLNEINAQVVTKRESLDLDIVRMLNEGHTYREISKVMECSLGLISKVRVRQGHLLNNFQ